MSMAKTLLRKLPGMTPAEIVAERDRLTKTVEAERNPRIRSSLRERIRDCEWELKKRGVVG